MAKYHTVEEWLGKDNALGIDIWTKKYQYNNESFPEWLERVSGGDDEVAKLIEDKKFLFGGRTLANRGTGKKGSFSNCYSRGFVEDDLDDIMRANTDIARTFKAQGGQGISLSKLRPKGCGINHGQFASDGIVPFMEVYNRTTESISQGGSRKGALIMSLDIWHKEAAQFITIKSEEGRIQKANLSLEIDDEFMECVKKYYDTGEIVKKEITRDYEGNKVTYEVVPIELYKLMMKTAYDWAEPGCIFVNPFRNFNLMEFCDDYNIECCNPCGEQPLAKNSACNLASLNVSEFVNDEFTANATFDYDAFSKAVKIAIRGLDDVLDENMNNHPLKEQREMAYNYRNVGLGIMGLADCLIKLGVTYGSKKSIEAMDDIMNTMFKSAVIASVNLAKDKGAFPKYNSKLLESTIITNHFTSKELDVIGATTYGLRNCSLLSIAPTGSLGTMLNISTGCEPIFAMSYTRKTESLNNNQDKYYKVYTGIAKEYIDKFGGELPYYFVESKDINWKDRVNMQSVLQKHVDTAISSTINLPNEITVDEIETLYLYAWEKKLKGITIFRDGCKRVGILSTSDNDTTNNDETDLSLKNSNDLPRGYIIKTDDNCIGKKRTLVTGCGTLHCEAFFDPLNGDLLETYFSKGSSGGCVDADTEYFNGYEWKKISKYKRGSGEKVLQYNENGIAELVEPINYIVNNGINSLKHFTNNSGLDMVLSDDHRMFLYKNYCKYSMGIRKKLTTEILSVSEYLENKKERHVPTTFVCKTSGIPLSNEEIRLLTAVYADGRYDGHKIDIRLVKDRKKDRLRALLKECDIGWTERNIYNTKYTCFYFYPTPSIKEWFVDKQFTHKWYNCTDDQLKTIIDECVYWDGSVGTGNRLGEYYSSKKNEVDFIQFALHRLGYRASISLNNTSKSEKPSYRVRWTTQNVHNLKHAQISIYNTLDNRSYCFTVPSGLLVLRRNDKIFITGNCNNFMIGLSRMISLSCRGGIDIYSIVDQLKSSGTCPSYAVRRATKHDTSKGSCCPVAIGNALIEMYDELQMELGLRDENEEIDIEIVTSKNPDINTNNISQRPKCPQCGEELIFEGGCNICKSCGWSRCD